MGEWLLVLITCDFCPVQGRVQSMAALVMALVAGMAVGDGPGQVSAEARLSFLGTGYWEGTTQFCDYFSPKEEIYTWPAWVAPNLLLSGGPFVLIAPIKWIDEGGGRCQQIILNGQGGLAYYGIYKRDGAKITVCVNKCGKRPMMFMADRYHDLFIFKPGDLPKDKELQPRLQEALLYFRDK
jgi:hypothetical protein